jgi:hypothetical protein
LGFDCVSNKTAAVFISPPKETPAIANHHERKKLSGYNARRSGLHVYACDGSASPSGSLTAAYGGIGLNFGNQFRFRELELARQRARPVKHVVQVIGELRRYIAGNEART